MTFVPPIPTNRNNDIGQFTRFAIPLVKRYYTSHIENKIMVVQPMTATILPFYLKSEPVNWKKEGF